MKFAIDTFTKAKLNDVIALSQKNRQPEDNPGAKLPIEFELPSSMLAMFSGFLRSMVLEPAANAKQGSVDGLEAEQLTEIGQHIGVMRWNEELTGYRLIIDRGLGGKSNLEAADCMLSGWRLSFKPGSFKVKVNVESSDVSETSFGRLAKMKSCEITIKLLAPEVSQGDIDDDEPPARAAKKAPATRKSATDEFVDRHAPTH